MFFGVSYVNNDVDSLRPARASFNTDSISSSYVDPNSGSDAKPNSSPDTNPGAALTYAAGYRSLEN